MTKKQIKTRLLKLGINFGTLFERTGKSRQWGYQLMNYDINQAKQEMLIGLAILKEDIEQFEEDLLND